MKSRYSLPSASQTRDPWPRSSTIGPAAYTAAPREGEFTPSTSDCCARSNHSWERVRLRVWMVCAMSLEFLSNSLRVVAASVRQPPAVHYQRRPRHERRIIRGQKQYSLRDLVGCADPSHGTVCAPRQILLPLQTAHSRIFGKHGRVDVT